MKLAARGRLSVPAKPSPAFRTPPVGRIELDARRLARELAHETDAEVRFSAGSRALYGSGGSNYRQLPIGVVIPRTIDDVVTTVALCRHHGAPVLNIGGHTSLAGQSVNVAVVIDFSKYLNEIVSLDPVAKTARVQPGLILDHLRKPAREEHQLTFGPDPSTHDHCTLGGMIGNNSCGVRSVQAQFYGPGPRMGDNVVELDVLTYDGHRFTVGKTSDEELERIVAAGGRRGEIYAALRDQRDRAAQLIRDRYPQIPRRVSGYSLDALLPEHGFDVAAALAGSEGTCVTILEATVQLLDYPKERSLLVIGYEDACVAADHVMTVLEHKPLGLEGVDDVLVEDMALLDMNLQDLELMPDGHGWLLVEFGGETKEEADAKAHDLMRDLRKDGVPPKDMSLFDDPEQELKVWEVREAGLGATAFIPGKPDAYEGWEDSAVPPEQLGTYLRRLKKLLGEYGYFTALYGHYGQGCVHARINFDLKSAHGIKTFRRFLDEASDLVLELGGSLSGEHGDGQSRAELLPKMYGDELVEEFRTFKAIWDPDWKMNPGKKVDPYRITDNLRFGTSYNPPKVETHFAFEEDRGDFAHAATRCVGIGKCRRTEGGVMCPSFMVTRDEKHTTRGRAHLLWEMLNGDELEAFEDEEVFEALDLCLSCKGCTHDCPVNVDMPTLKAEFLSHYYAGKPRPRHAYAFGLIDRAARLAARAPGLANFVTQTPGVSALAKRVAGVAPQRKLPPFAEQPLQAWFRARGERNLEGPRVLLWPDTFTNYFHSGVGVAAVETLEAAGYHVVMPKGHVCCGRPLYDYGMLDLAGRYLDRTLGLLRDEIRAGTPIVGLEPSCVAVFKDELRKLRPNDEDGKRLCQQVHHFAELLAERDDFEPPQLQRKVVLHGHCHHKATGGIDPEQQLLEKMGADVEAPDSGCCGMAGAWGYETAHYDVSMAAGERVLLPAVRAASTDTLIVADGFSCKTQIEQGHTGRRALHLAEVLALAREWGPDGPPRGCAPESYVAPPPSRPRAKRRNAAAAGVATGALAAGAWASRRRRR